MTMSEAVKEMLKGGIIRRKCWEFDRYIGYWNEFVLEAKGRTVTKVDAISIDSVFADDWEVIA